MGVGRQRHNYCHSCGAGVSVLTPASGPPKTFSLNIAKPSLFERGLEKAYYTLTYGGLVTIGTIRPVMAHASGDTGRTSLTGTITVLRIEPTTLV